MKRPATVFLLFVFVLAAYPLFAQSAPAPQEAGKSEQTRVLTGTIRKISADRIWIAQKKEHVTVVYSFIVTGDTVIEGDLSVGKTAAIEFTSTVVKKSHEANTTRKTAVKISVVP